MHPDVEYSLVSELNVVFSSEDGSLLERLQYDRGVSGECFLEQLQVWERELARGFDRLLALDGLQLQLYDHQRRAVLRVLRDMRGRALLADEVGLGKTIEAGVILKEYIVRGLARSALILAPAALTEQWRSELRDKLEIDCHVYAAGDVWQQHELLITSLDTARRAEHASALQSKVWDVVIVDEAHRLKNRDTRSWQLVDGLQKKYLLLLTATPIQNDLDELYNMMTLLQPGLLQTYSAFKREFVQDKRSPKRTEQLRSRIGQVLVRTTRAESGIQWPKRIVHNVSVPLNGREQAFYERVVAFARGVFVRGGDRTNMLPLILLLRELCSSPEAVRRTLRRLAAPGRLEASDSRRASELAEEAGRLCGHSSKVQAAVRWLLATKEPAIIFTQFRATQAALAAALRQHSLPVALFHGGMEAEEKRATLERFRRIGGVLISTEAGSEGQNLQFCATVVNHDLPWNPMRVEQRIGRVHRLGQTRDVLIVNLLVPDTMEMHVFRLLHEKIRLFEQVIGDLDVILASSDPDELLPGSAFANDLGRIFLTSADEKTTAEQLEVLGRHIERAGVALDTIRQRNDRLLSPLGGTEAQTRVSGYDLPAVTRKQPLPVVTATLLHSLCLDVQFAADVLGPTKQPSARTAAMSRRLNRLRFVNVHARLLQRRLLHHAHLLFCFKVAYRSDETHEHLHTLLVDPVTEAVRPATLPENPVPLTLGDIVTPGVGGTGRLAPYVLERLQGRARQFLREHIVDEGQQYINEARARLDRDKQRLDEFYAALQDEAFIPVVQQLRRLEVRRTREQWLRSVAPGKIQPAGTKNGIRQIDEIEQVKHRLEVIRDELNEERHRRLHELSSKYAVRAEVTLVGVATLFLPRVELRYKVISPVRQELVFYYDPLRNSFIDLDCERCTSALEAVHMDEDGLTVCAACLAAVTAESG